MQPMRDHWGTAIHVLSNYKLTMNATCGCDGELDCGWDLDWACHCVVDDERGFELECDLWCDDDGL